MISRRGLLFLKSTGRIEHLVRTWIRERVGSTPIITLKHLFVLVTIAALFALTAAGCGGSTSSASSGQALYQKANDLYKASQYTKAEKLYWKALPMLAGEGRTTM